MIKMEKKCKKIWGYFRIGPVQDRHEIESTWVFGGEESISGSPKCRKWVVSKIRAGAWARTKWPLSTSSDSTLSIYVMPGSAWIAIYSLLQN